MGEGKMKRGFFIPADIWDNPDLTLQEKVILAEIASFSKNGKECYISNSRIAEILGLQIRQAENIFYCLVAKGIVKTTRFDGKNRYVKVVEGWQSIATQTRNVVRGRLAKNNISDSQSTATKTRNVVRHTISTDTTYPSILESTDKNIHDKKERKTFVSPSVEDVIDYACSIGHPEFNAEYFVDHYTGNGWKVGKTAMKDWRATVRNWIRRDTERSEGRATSYTSKLNLL